MNNDKLELCEEAVKEFKERLLELEKENIINNNQAVNKQMVSRIISLYEEVKAKYENKQC